MMKKNMINKKSLPAYIYQSHGRITFKLRTASAADKYRIAKEATD